VLAVVVLAVPSLRERVGDAAPGLREKHTHHHSGEKYPNNTEGRLYARASVNADPKKVSVSTAFSPATQKDGEAFNAHDGEWELDSGRLEATQAGSVPSDGKKLRPRAILEDRYFSSDDFTAEVEMAYQTVDDQFTLESDDQRSMELAFRTRDINIAVWAIPGKEIRLMWKYLTADGVDQAGNSARDPDLEMNDEVPTPPERTPFRVQLSLKKLKQGVQVEAKMNGTRIARKYLPGLSDATGRLALGCRNLHCEFDDLTVQGAPKVKPDRPDAGSAPP